MLGRDLYAGKSRRGVRGSWNLVMHEDESRNKARRERERPCSVVLAVRGKIVAGLLLQANELGLELEGHAGAKLACVAGSMQK